jgi:nicotinamidase/pyrazinamidase
VILIQPDKLQNMKKILLRLLLAIGIIIAIVFVNYVIFNYTAQRISEGTPISTSNSGNKALVIIDIQEGTTGSVSVTDSYKQQSEELIGNLNRLTEEAEERGWQIIYIKSEVTNPLINILNNTLAKGSEGAKLDKRMIIRSDHILIKKKNDSFNDTELDRILTEMKISKLCIVGLDAAHCVNHMVRAALNRGYDIEVIDEAIISKTDAEKEGALDDFRYLGVSVIHMGNTD